MHHAQRLVSVLMKVTVVVLDICVRGEVNAAAREEVGHGCRSAVSWAGEHPLAIRVIMLRCPTTSAEEYTPMDCQILELGTACGEHRV